MFSRTGPLRRELARAFPDRPFAVSLWDGSALPATRPDAPTFVARSPLALAHVLRSPGELGLGRAYVAGLLDVDDIDAAIDIVTSWEPPPLSLADQARLAGAAVQACGLLMPPKIPSIEMRQNGPLHSIGRDRRAIAHHYDAGNDFFALFLDTTMTYSCAVFARGATTLEEAQQTKLDLVCTKLALQPGQRMLDVGCGWGSLAINAASNFGARVLGVTISKQQAQLARERVRAAGVGELVEIREADYRELAEEPFDAIASVGMVEHVGELRIDEYARQLSALLRPGGRLLNHGIAQLRHGVDNDAGPFSERYIFPDGEPLHLSRVQLALERAGLRTEHVEGFADDYAQTITHWIERFEARFDEACAIAGPERARVWRLYLRGAREGFRSGFESIYQVRAHKPG